MDFFNIIISFLSNVERTTFKIPDVIPLFDFNNRRDIETGLYYGEDTYIITIRNSNKNNKYTWDAESIL
jgi:hypothetical protein